jgi:hypothetical protein
MTRHTCWARILAALFEGLSRAGDARAAELDRLRVPRDPVDRPPASPGGSARSGRLRTRTSSGCSASASPARSSSRTPRPAETRAGCGRRSPRRSGASPVPATSRSSGPGPTWPAGGRNRHGLCWRRPAPDPHPGAALRLAAGVPGRDRAGPVGAGPRGAAGHARDRRTAAAAPPGRAGCAGGARAAPGRPRPVRFERGVRQPGAAGGVTGGHTGGRDRAHADRPGEDDPRDLPSLLSLSDIAVAHRVSENTIKTHVRAIYDKLGVHTRREAVQRATDLGVL